MNNINLFIIINLSLIFMIFLHQVSILQDMCFPVVTLAGGLS